MYLHLWATNVKTNKKKKNKSEPRCVYFNIEFSYMFKVKFSFWMLLLHTCVRKCGCLRCRKSIAYRFSCVRVFGRRIRKKIEFREDHIKSIETRDRQIDSRPNRIGWAFSGKKLWSIGWMAAGQGWQTTQTVFGANPNCEPGRPVANAIAPKPNQKCYAAATLPHCERTTRANLYFRIQHAILAPPYSSAT